MHLSAFYFFVSDCDSQCGQLPEQPLQPTQPPDFRVRRMCRAAKKTASASSSTMRIVAKFSASHANIKPLLSSNSFIVTIAHCAQRQAYHFYIDWDGKASKSTPPQERLQQPFRYRIRRP